MGQFGKSKFEEGIFINEIRISFMKIHDNMIIEHSYPLTDFQNSRIMEIHDTSDDVWCNLWNEKCITKIFDWIMEYTAGTSRTYKHTIAHNYYNFIEQIIYLNFESVKLFIFIRIRTPMSPNKTTSDIFSVVHTAGKRHKNPYFFVLPIEFGVNVDIHKH